MNGGSEVIERLRALGLDKTQMMVFASRAGISYDVFQRALERGTASVLAETAIKAQLVHWESDDGMIESATQPGSHTTHEAPADNTDQQLTIGEDPMESLEKSAMEPASQPPTSPESRHEATEQDSSSPPHAGRTYQPTSHSQNVTQMHVESRAIRSELSGTQLSLEQQRQLLGMVRLPSGAALSENQIDVFLTSRLLVAREVVTAVRQAISDYHAGRLQLPPADTPSIEVESDQPELSRPDEANDEANASVSAEPADAIGLVDQEVGLESATDTLEASPANSLELSSLSASLGQSAKMIPESASKLDPESQRAIAIAAHALAGLLDGSIDTMKFEAEVDQDLGSINLDVSFSHRAKGNE